MIDTGGFVRIEAIPPDESDEEGLSEHADEARWFLAAHSWCGKIIQGYLAEGWPGVLSVFFFEIEPSPGSGADDAVWVIVGDLPPTYLDVVNCGSSAEALEGYCTAFDEWVVNVKSGKPVFGLVPAYRRNSFIEIPTDLEHAEMVSSRLEFIRERLVPELRFERDEA